MIYLTHPDGSIAACETERAVARYEAQGFTRCTCAAFCAAWQERDTPKQERAVGETVVLCPRKVSEG